MSVDKHILVTGISGFVGHHLTASLKEAGCRVTGLGREPGAPTDLSPQLSGWVSCDLLNRGAVQELDLSKYDGIISLAGLAAVGASFDNAELYMQTNVNVLSNLCTALVSQKLNPRLLAVSTGAVYDGSQPMPLTEVSGLIKTGSPYALSKVAMEAAAQDFKAKGLDNIVIARPFNHIGPGQNPGFIVPDMYKKIMGSLKSGGEIKTGNLATKRDYTDVRDVTRAYVNLVLADKANLSSVVYNVCSGASHSGQEIVDELVRNIPGADKLVFVRDPGLIRPNDPRELIGSHELLSKDTGWSPKIPLSQSISDFVASQNPIK